MFHILSFVYLAYLSGKLFSKRAYSRDNLILSGLCFYVGLIDLCNTNSTLFTNGFFFILASLLIKAVIIVCCNAALAKAKKASMKTAKRSNVSYVNFKREKGRSVYGYKNVG